MRIICIQGLTQTAKLLQGYRIPARLASTWRTCTISCKSKFRSREGFKVWFHRSKVYSDLGSFWVFLSALSGISFLLNSLHCHMMAASSNWYSTLWCLFPVGWDRLTFPFQEPQASFSLHLVGLNWLSSAHLWTNPWQKGWDHLVWLKTNYLGLDECREIFQFCKMSLQLEIPTYKPISQTSIGEGNCYGWHRITDLL